MQKPKWTAALAALSLVAAGSAAAADWPYDTHGGLECRKSDDSLEPWEVLDDAGVRWNVSLNGTSLTCPIPLRTAGCDAFQVSVLVSDGHGRQDVECEIVRHDTSGQYANLLSHDVEATRSSSGKGLQKLGLPFVAREEASSYVLRCRLPEGEGVLAESQLSGLVHYEVLQICD